MTTKVLQQIGKRIRACRKLAHLTQQELAEAADLDYKTIQRLEGKIQRFHPNIDTLEKIARALEVSVSELLKE